MEWHMQTQLTKVLLAVALGLATAIRNADGSPPCSVGSLEGCVHAGKITCVNSKTRFLETVKSCQIAVFFLRATRAGG